MVFQARDSGGFGLGSGSGVGEKWTVLGVVSGVERSGQIWRVALGMTGRGVWGKEGTWQ